MGNVKAMLTALGTFLIIPPLTRHGKGNFDFLVCVLMYVSGGFLCEVLWSKAGHPIARID